MWPCQNFVLVMKEDEAGQDVRGDHVVVVEHLAEQAGNILKFENCLSFRPASLGLKIATVVSRVAGLSL